MNVIVDRDGSTLTEKNKEMDRRAEEAVAAAVHKAKVKGKPLAKFDKEAVIAFLEYRDRYREYIEE